MNRKIKLTNKIYKTLNEGADIIDIKDFNIKDIVGLSDFINTITEKYIENPTITIMRIGDTSINMKSIEVKGFRIWVYGFTEDNSWVAKEGNGDISAIKLDFEVSTPFDGMKYGGSYLLNPDFLKKMGLSIKGYKPDKPAHISIRSGNKHSILTISLKKD